MHRLVISTTKAPKAIGPYSQAIKAGNTLYVSGQLGLNPSNMQFVDGGVEAQARQALINMGEILKAADCSYESVVKTTVLLKNMDDFTKVNEVYKTFFKVDPPARSAFEVARLPKDGLVEIEAIALTN